MTVYVKICSWLKTFQAKQLRGIKNREQILRLRLLMKFNVTIVES